MIIICCSVGMNLFYFLIILALVVYYYCTHPILFLSFFSVPTFLHFLNFFITGASRGQCHMHVHQFWWTWSLRFQRYGYLSKTAKFPFRGMDYSPWSSKNLIDQNQLKKFMQVGVNVMCMYTSFGGRGLSGFGDKISLKSMLIKKFN